MYMIYSVNFYKKMIYSVKKNVYDIIFFTNLLKLIFFILNIIHLFKVSVATLMRKLI